MHGPIPELTDFVMGKKHPIFRSSLLGLVPHGTFAELFDHAQDRIRWRSWVHRLTKHSINWPPPPEPTDHFVPMGDLENAEEEE